MSVNYSKEPGQGVGFLTTS